MKNKLALILALTICASAFAGCGGASSGESSKAAESSAEVAETADNSGDTIAEETASEKLLAEYPVNDGAYDFKQGATENMLGRSLLNRGDTSRLAAKIQRAVDDPKAVTNICYLGDSITAGSGASGSAKQYTNLITAWWEENLSLYVLGTNAGIGATDSYLAVHRAYRDVPPESDIIFIEFINDQDSEFYQATMDSLVRYCLALENQPAVILIEPSTEGGGSPQSAHLKVAETYDLPMISYHDAIIPEIDAGNFAWKDTSNDNVHPNDAGHAVMAQCVLNLFDQVKDGLENESKEVTPFDPAAVESPTGDRFAGATLGSADTPELVEVVDAGTFTESAQFGNFSGGWGSTTGGSAVFKIKCKDLGILYHKNISGTFGKVAVKVDDNAAVIVDGDFPGGWGNYPKAEEIFSSDETAEHTVKVEFINGDTAPDFEILGWMIS
ncbi:GDSL family lipase [Ruminococcus albus SY3]|uniref:GDSL family lipase n=1 Tax=Ruminococcus albus SY3 TaxID=1341156 RepID=A0A011UE74_RUMAL|nr:SGNH/GDSL hydrolase family protein [Ruminococcus albus]EXM38924.1 GDSL family lipase [Ruminococcus albus SY3]